jgi:hypothetical protein
VARKKAISFGVMRASQLCEIRFVSSLLSATTDAKLGGANAAYTRAASKYGTICLIIISSG